MKSSQHGLNELGYTCAALAKTIGSNGVNRSKTVKLCHLIRSDCSLQLENMKQESLVIAYQQNAVNTFHFSYTPPVTSWELQLTEAICCCMNY